MLSIDQSPDRGAKMAADSVTVQGASIKIAVNGIRGNFDGTLSEDGNSMAGTWSQGLPLPGIEPFPPAPTTPLPPIMQDIMTGTQHYTAIPVPILAIYALPHDLGPAAANPTMRAQGEANDAKGKAQAKAFETGLPSAHVVRIPRANHFVFLSNEPDVLREMEAFLAGLK